MSNCESAPLTTLLAPTAASSHRRPLWDTRQQTRAQGTYPPRPGYAERYHEGIISVFKFDEWVIIDY